MTSIKSLTRSSTMILSVATICFAVSAQVSSATVQDQMAAKQLVVHPLD